MIRDQFSLDLSAELIVDNFAGGGGASTGIELALGRGIDIAINHDPEAVALHSANHPQTVHHCESVWDIDIVKATSGRPVGLAWFSPDCKHFSKAKGGKPRSKKIRGLAWIVVKWAATVKPRVIMLENVEEFQDWGPLLKDGSPCKKRKGRTFRNWVKRLQNLGYVVEWNELRACDYGAPTIRKRLFLIARCDGKPIVWPESTHGAPSNPDVISGKLKPWRTAAECIDWTLPTPSIFTRSRPLAEATCRRIAKGIMRYVVNCAEPFVIPLTHHGESDRVTQMGAPLPTITAAHRGEMALVTPVITECANATTARSMPADEPLRTQCAEVKGGHFALIAPHISKFRTGSTGSAMTDPLHTITAGPKEDPAGAPHAMGVVSAFLAKHYGGVVASHLVKLRGDANTHAPGLPATEPIHTVSAQGNHFAEVRAFLIKYYGADQDPRLEEPMHTVTSRDRFGLVTVNGEKFEISDIGLRMLQPRELYRAQGFPESYIIGDRPSDRIKLSKSAQVRMCGNSVCPPMAAALVRANVPELAAWSREEARLACAQ